MFSKLRAFINDLKLSGQFGKAHKMHMGENHEGALEVLDTIMRSSPSDYLVSSVLLEQGEIEYRLGSYQKSIERLEMFKASVSDIADQKGIQEQIDRANVFINAAKSKT